MKKCGVNGNLREKSETESGPAVYLWQEKKTETEPRVFALTEVGKW